jgi:HEAT repeat protein
MKSKFMKRLLPVCLATVVVCGARAAEEQELIATLQSSATVPQKCTACQRLKIIGTAQSVPALAALLGEARTAHAARYALESMPYPQAGAALREALSKTDGLVKAGLIDSLGWRREPEAIPLLTPLLADTNATVAAAAATALGRMGGDAASASLQKALAAAAEPLRGAIVEALLDCATHQVAAGQQKAARKIYQQFQDAKESENVRAAAYLGLMHADEKRALALVRAGLAGTDRAQHTAALAMAGEVQGTKATAAFAKLLPKVSPPLQIALLRLLQQRGDAAAAPAVFKVAQGTADPDVRRAALAALGGVGDAQVVAWLAQTAATAADKAEQKAARQALLELHHGDIPGALLALLPAANPGEQTELIRVLAARPDKSSATRLLEMAQAGDAATRQVALRGLKSLATAAHLPALVKLLEQAPDDTVRAAAQSVIQSLAARTPAGQAVDVAPLVQGLLTTNTATRIALLQVGALFTDARLHTALRAAVRDANDAIRAAAIAALCESHDVQLMPDLLELAKNAKEPGCRAGALAGYVRLVGEDDAQFPVGQRAKMLQAAYPLATSVEGKRLILSALATAPTVESLEFVTLALNEPEIKPEAEAACVRLATTLLPTEPTEASAALRRLTAAGSSPNVQAQAQTLLKQFGSEWLCSGPYRQAGRKCQDFFDLPLGPERPGTSQHPWRRVSGTSDLMKRGKQGVVEGHDCVVYLKTRVFAPTAQSALFLIGSDDGIKLWVNGDLVHANNAVRGLTPGQDRATGKLRAGWNELLAKVTQSTAGCGMTLDITNADGSEIPGLRFDPQGETCTAEKTGFQKIKLTDQFYAEGAAYADFNHDGKVDVVAGPFWFAGPDFKARHEYRPAKPFDPKHYSDNFLTFVADFNGDGWADVFCVPLPGAEGYWYENPQGKNEAWPRHLAVPMVGNESPGWVDVNGDGRPDLIFNNNGFFGYATWDPAKPNEPWLFHAVSPKTPRFQRFTHGIGAGDINGDGRVDMVEATGWWEQPAAATAAWQFHPHKFAQAAAQMFITDVDGDGLADVITAWHCHHYGLVWWRQTKDAQGASAWQQHTILSPTPDLGLADLRISQLHALDLADMNGDGLKDIVTGKRFWAHGPTGDKEPDAPAVLYWFELQRAGGKATFAPHRIDDDSGVGTQVTAGDVNGDGRPDVIVANKKGIFVFQTLKK